VPWKISVEKERLSVQDASFANQSKDAPDWRAEKLPIMIGNLLVWQ
jgi:hypothetical protein